jgi:Fe-S oxidoreductase
LIKDGKLNLTTDFNYKKITYHDPCYLGRGNDIYESPRDLIANLNIDFVEMPRNKRKSFCCGAGGAQMFKEAENGKFEINIIRTEEALKTGADVIATGCPFCNTMMTDGVKNISEGQAQVKDIAELIAECI